MELVVFNNSMDDMLSNSLCSVQSGYPSNVGGTAAPGASGTTFLNKIPGIPQFSGTKREKDTV